MSVDCFGEAEEVEDICAEGDEADAAEDDDEAADEDTNAAEDDADVSGLEAHFVACELSDRRED
jgi:hypothetical protein